MPQEIERKFLVDSEKLPPLKNPYSIRQGYLPGVQTATVRIRIRDDQAFLTLKGNTSGISRAEYEYAIALSDAEEMLKGFCDGLVVEKRRYLLWYEGYRWEIDLFEGENEGLVIAEIELSDAEERFAKPEWVAEEVSLDPKYRNSNLIRHPYREWERSSTEE